jgi:hypothetical protein
MVAVAEANGVENIECSFMMRALDIADGSFIIIWYVLLKWWFSLHSFHFSSFFF